MSGMWTSMGRPRRSDWRSWLLSTIILLVVVGTIAALGEACGGPL
jgi:hypothetical protein